MRGDIYRLRGDKRAVGHEQQGSRYAVVVQSDMVRLSTLLAAPTSTSALSTDFRVSVEFGGRRTLVMCDQVSAVGPDRRFGDRVGQISAVELIEVDEALRAVMGLL